MWVVRFLLCVMIVLAAHANVVCARVDHDIQDAYEERFEDKAFFLRESLVHYGSAGLVPQFITTFEEFVYPADADASTAREVFRRGERVLITKVDFDAKKIEVSLKSLETDQAGELVFKIGKRLSEAFEEEAAFLRRFYALFMQESLKKSTVSSDDISTYLSSGSVTVGMTKDDLLLGLGQPYDSMKRFDGKLLEVLTYKRAAHTYTFYFVDNHLTEYEEY